MAPALQNLLISCDLSAGVRPEVCPVCCKNPPVWALLTDAVAGEGEAFEVSLCEEAEGAELAVPAQPDLLGMALGRENCSSGVLKEERLLRGRAGGGRWEQGLLLFSLRLFWFLGGGSSVPHTVL